MIAITTTVVFGRRRSNPSGKTGVARVASRRTHVAILLAQKGGRPAAAAAQRARRTGQAVDVPVGHAAADGRGHHLAFEFEQVALAHVAHRRRRQHVVQRYVHGQIGHLVQYRFRARVHHFGGGTCANNNQTKRERRVVSTGGEARGREKIGFSEKKYWVCRPRRGIYAGCVVGAVCWNRKLNRQLNAAHRKPVKARAAGGTEERRVNNSGGQKVVVGDQRVCRAEERRKGEKKKFDTGGERVRAARENEGRRWRRSGAPARRRRRPAYAQRARHVDRAAAGWRETRRKARHRVGRGPEILNFFF